MILAIVILALLLFLLLQFDSRRSPRPGNGPEAPSRKTPTAPDDGVVHGATPDEVWRGPLPDADPPDAPATDQFAPGGGDFGGGGSSGSWGNDSSTGSSNE